MKLSVVALLLCAVLTACSGGPDQGLSKAAYVQQANALCTQALADQRAVKPPAAPAQLGAYVSQVVAIAVRATDSLGRLAAPAHDRSELQDKFLGPLQDRAQQAKAYAEDVAAAGARNDQAALGRLAQQPPGGPEIDQGFAAAYGLSPCVGAGTTP